MKRAMTYFVLALMAACVGDTRPLMVVESVRATDGKIECVLHLKGFDRMPAIIALKDASGQLQVMTPQLPWRTPVSDAVVSARVLKPRVGAARSVIQIGFADARVEEFAVEWTLGGDK